VNLEPKTFLKGGFMEPAGRYALDNFRVMLRPSIVKCKSTFCNFLGALKALIVAIPFALAIGVATLFKRRKNE
jgi:hypothetical protein